jgi:predicted site-specific integrase-resolvase
LGGETLVGDGTWLTPNEVAERLAISVGTARSYADAGQIEHNGIVYKLTSRRLGRLGHRRVLASDVEAARKAMFGTTGDGPDAPR